MVGRTWDILGKFRADPMKGMIVMWSGAIASIPTGWLLCDGNNGTPDLRDKFVVGAKQDDAGVAKTNVTGALTQSGGVTTHTHGLTGTYSPYWAQDTGLTHAAGVVPNDGASPATTDVQTPTAVVPPYYALAFIMKA